MHGHGVNAPLCIPGVNCCVDKRGELLCACLVTLLPDQDLHALPNPINASLHNHTIHSNKYRVLQHATLEWNVRMTSNKVSGAACWRQPVEETLSDCTEAAMKLAVPTF